MASFTGSLWGHPLYLASTWRQRPPPGHDSGLRASRYLQAIRDLAINPHWIGLAEHGADCSPSLAWLGAHIDGINHQLHTILGECLDCFHGEHQPAVQILAAPILRGAGIDGFCNLTVYPITLVVDPSRVEAPDWPKLVMHELAHGMARSAGHGDAFRAALAHLCLAFDLPEPPEESSPGLLQAWPPYRARANRADFCQAPEP